MSLGFSNFLESDPTAKIDQSESFLPRKVNLVPRVVSEPLFQSSSSETRTETEAQRLPWVRG